jgi:tripartite-type tricarboxylate transporter receptor subunit TctC
LFDAGRSAALPEVPAMAEALGVAGYEATPLWYGFVTRAGAPQEVVTRLNELVTEAMKSKEVDERLVALGAQPITPTNHEFAAQMKAEVEKSARIAKALGIAK